VKHSLVASNHLFMVKATANPEFATYPSCVWPCWAAEISGPD